MYVIKMTWCGTDGHLKSSSKKCAANETNVKKTDENRRRRKINARELINLLQSCACASMPWKLAIKSFRI